METQLALPALPADFWWRFAAAAIVVHGVMMALAAATKNVAPTLWTRAWWKAFVACQNVTWGAVVGLPPFLPFASMLDRVMVGIGAGLVSHLAYEALTKRLAVVAGKPAAVGPVPAEPMPGGGEGP